MYTVFTHAKKRTIRRSTITKKTFGNPPVGNSGCGRTLKDGGLSPFDVGEGGQTEKSLLISNGSKPTVLWRRKDTSKNFWDDSRLAYPYPNITIWLSVIPSIKPIYLTGDK